MPAIIQNTGRAKCIFEPRGDAGLEGYSRGELYRYEYMTPADKRPYYRVWPVEGDTYYETCSPTSFKKYFSTDNSTAAP